MRYKLFLIIGLLIVFVVACHSEPQVVELEVIVTRIVEKEVVVEGGVVVVTSLASGTTQDLVEHEAVVEGVPIIITEIVEMEIVVEVTRAPESIVPQSPHEPLATQFEETAVNPFVDTRDDNLSTFAIDVDTGSYTVMRGYLSDYGALPPPESVRVEEYINYFDYNYPRPESGAFAIHVDGAPAPYGESEAFHLVRIGIQGYEPPAEQRPDALLIFVIDVSGSMSQDNRLGLVKESLLLLLNELRPTDRVGIVTYGSRAQIVLDPTSVTNRKEIESVIRGLQVGGSTNVAEGIKKAYLSANRYALDGQITRLIVLSDGVANVGSTTAEQILDYARRGISLSTFGFGIDNYNDTLMEQLADQGDGSYAYIDTLREAQRLFVTNLSGTLMTIAKDAKIQVEFNSDVVETYRLLGYENREVADGDFRNDAVDAGEIGAGHSVTALYEIRLAEDVDASATALSVHVRYEDPDSGEVVELLREATIASFADTFAASSPSFQLAAVVAEYAELLKESYWARDNDLRDMWPDAEQVARLMRGNSQAQEFAELAEGAASYR